MKSDAIPSQTLRQFILYLFLTFLFFSLSDKTAFAQTTPFLVSPYYGSPDVNQGYSANNHPAYDYNLIYVPVLASAAGNIQRVQWVNNAPECHGPTSLDYCSYGLHIYIEHPNGHVSRYGHLSSTVYGLDSSGQAVQGGEVIGTSGNTGWSTGPHLHFEVRSQNGAAADPNNPSLWKDGQWAIPSRPITLPVSGGELAINTTIDNSAGFSKGHGGTFNNQCANNCGGWTQNGSTYWTLANGSVVDAWAKWQLPSIPVSPIGGAIYEVLVYIPNPNVNTFPLAQTTWQARYTIQYTTDGTNNTTASAVIDQRGARGNWMSLGTYRMNSSSYVALTDATGEIAQSGSHCGTSWCYIFADTVKFVRRGTVYGPDVRYSSSGGFTSKVYLYNNGAGLANILLKFMTAYGTVACSTTPTLFARQSNSYACNDSQVASVILDSSQDMTIVVENRKTGESTNYSGIPAGNGSTGWDSTGTTLYIPTLKYGLYSRSGRIYLLNAGTTTTNVTVDLWRQDSNVHYSCGTSLVAQGRTTIDPAGCGGAVAGYLYGAKITSVSTGGSDPVDPLAAVVVEKNDSGAELQASTNAFAFGNGTNYSPLVKNSYYGNQATMVVQNVGSLTTNVYVTYYYSGTTSTTTFNNLPSGSSHIFAPQIGGVPPVPTGTLASVRTTSSGQPLVTALYENKTGASWRMQHSGFTSGSKVVILPRLAKNYNDGSLIWQSGYLVQNVGTVNTTVTVKYYNMDGTYAGNTPSFSVQPNCSYVVNVTNNSTMSSPWQVSALVVADQPIVISGNLTNNGSGDAAMSYSGVNR